MASNKESCMLCLAAQWQWVVSQGALFGRFPLVIANYTSQATTASLSALGNPPLVGDHKQLAALSVDKQCLGTFLVLNETSPQLLAGLPSSLIQKSFSRIANSHMVPLINEIKFYPWVLHTHYSFIIGVLTGATVPFEDGCVCLLASLQNPPLFKIRTTYL